MCTGKILRQLNYLKSALVNVNKPMQEFLKTQKYTISVTGKLCNPPFDKSLHLKSGVARHCSFEIPDNVKLLDFKTYAAWVPSLIHQRVKLLSQIYKFS